MARWQSNLGTGSRNTAGTYLRILGPFVTKHHLTPKSYIGLPAKRREDLLTDYITDLVSAPKSPSYILVVRQAILSWLKWNDVEVRRRIKIPSRNNHPTLRDAYIPTQDDLRRVLHAADARGRTALAFIAYAGLRPSVLGNSNGQDGLRFSDLPEAHFVGRPCPATRWRTSTNKART